MCHYQSLFILNCIDDAMVGNVLASSGIDRRLEPRTRKIKDCKILCFCLDYQRTTLGPKPSKASFILIPSPPKRTPMYDYWILLLKTVINTIKLASCVLRTYDHAHSATLLFGNTKWCMYNKPNILRVTYLTCLYTKSRVIN
jgi:hypothetical protein